MDHHCRVAREDHHGQARREGCDRDGRGAWSRAWLREAACRLGAKGAVTDLNLRSYEEFEAEAKDMTADSTVAEIEASGGTASGIRGRCP